MLIQCTEKANGGIK